MCAYVNWFRIEGLEDYEYDVSFNDIVVYGSN